MRKLILFALLLTGFAVDAQTPKKWTKITGNYQYEDSVRFKRLLNGQADGKALTTDGLGNLILVTVGGGEGGDTLAFGFGIDVDSIGPNFYSIGVDSAIMATLRYVDSLNSQRDTVAYEDGLLVDSLSPHFRTVAVDTVRIINIINQYAKNIYNSDGTITAGQDRFVTVPGTSSLIFSAKRTGDDSSYIRFSPAWFWAGHSTVFTQKDKNVYIDSNAISLSTYEGITGKGVQFTMGDIGTGEGAFFNDYTWQQRGIMYLDNYGPTFVDRSLVDKGYTDAAIAAAVSGLGTGTVESVASGLGLTGGPITTTGTLAVDTASVVIISRQRAAFTYLTIASPTFTGTLSSISGSVSVGGSVVGSIGLFAYGARAGNGTNFYWNSGPSILGSTNDVTIRNAAATAGANVSIGTSAAAASAILDVTSTVKGVLLPRMTTAQRNAISSPATGLTLFCTDCTATDTSTGVMQTYNGTTWKNNW